MNYGAEVMAARSPSPLRHAPRARRAGSCSGAARPASRPCQTARSSPDGTNSIPARRGLLGGSLHGSTLRPPVWDPRCRSSPKLRGPLAFVYVPTSGGGSSNGSGITNNTNAGTSQPLRRDGLCLHGGPRSSERPRALAGSTTYSSRVALSSSWRPGSGEGLGEQSPGLLDKAFAVQGSSSNQGGRTGQRSRDIAHDDLLCPAPEHRQRSWLPS